MVETIPAEIKDAYSSICGKFETSFNNKDSSGLGDLYTKDAKMMPPDMDIVVGRSAIQEFWQGALAVGIKSYEGELAEAELFGDTGYLVGTYKLLGQDGESIGNGKFMSILKKEEGKWKVHRDIYNSSPPAK
jgi:ketosteroid isomerase-like protein